MIIKKLSDMPIMKTAHNVDARNLYDTEHGISRKTLLGL